MTKSTSMSIMRCSLQSPNKFARLKESFRTKLNIRDNTMRIKDDEDDDDYNDSNDDASVFFGKQENTSLTKQGQD
jgi:hypothetical protein